MELWAFDGCSPNVKELLPRSAAIAEVSADVSVTVED
jgi:hypothetical protein